MGVCVWVGVGVRVCVCACLCEFASVRGYGRRACVVACVVGPRACVPACARACVRMRAFLRPLAIRLCARAVRARMFAFQDSDDPHICLAVPGVPPVSPHSS